MPCGVTGLLVAGLFAATMSSFDSALNSCSAVLMTDFIKSRSDHRVTLSRWITLGLGAMIILLAFNIAKLGSIFEIANKILNALGSPLLAIFLLGMFSKRANRRGVFWGGLIGMILSATISLSVKQLALHYYAVVNLGLTMLLAYLGSLIANYCSHSDTDLNQKWRWSSLMNTKN
jgi:Na+/proline symporter